MPALKKQNLKFSLWVVRGAVARHKVGDGVNLEGMTTFYKNMFAVLSQWSLETSQGGLQSKKLIGFFIAHHKSAESAYRAAGTLSVGSSTSSATKQPTTLQGGFEFVMVLKFDKEGQQSSVQDRFSKSTALVASLGGCKFGTDWECKCKSTSLLSLLTLMEEWVLHASLARGISHVLPSPAELSSRRALEVTHDDYVSHEHHARMAALLGELAWQLGHKAYARDQRVHDTHAGQPSDSVLERKSKLLIAAQLAQLPKLLHAKQAAPVVVEHEEGDAPAPAPATPLEAAHMALLQDTIEASLSAEVASAEVSSARIRRIIVGLAREVLDMRLQMAELIGRPNIHEHSSRLRRTVGTHMHQLPQATIDHILFARRMFEEAAAPLRSAMAELCPVSQQPPCISLLAFVASPFAPDQVYDVTAACVPSVLQYMVLHRAIPTPVITALMLCAEKKEQQATSIKEFMEDEDLGAEGAVAFMKGTQAMASTVHRRVVALQESLQKQRAEQGSHESVHESSKLFFAATPACVAEGLSMPATNYGEAAIVTIVVVCSTTKLALVLCSKDCITRDKGETECAGEGCPKTKELPHKEGAKLLARATVAAVKECKRVHILLLGCNMHQLVEALANAFTEKEREELPQLGSDVEVCFTTSLFPAGVIMLILQAYSFNLEETMADFKVIATNSISSWAEEYEKEALNDLNSGGKKLPPLVDRCACDMMPA